MTTRRDFLKISSLSVAGTGLLAVQNKGYSETADNQTSVSAQDNEDAKLWYAEGKPLRAALIGCGWYGKSDLFRLIQCGGDKIQVVALCEVDSNVLAQAGQLVAQRQANKQVPNLYKDYREMLRKEKLDVCLVGTPDHWHALNMIAACEAGCDVYVQKPIGVDVKECKAMLDAARKYNRVVQVGLQRRSTPVLIEAKNKFINSGAIGQIANVNTYCDWGTGFISQNPADVPDYLDFDMWTGPAPLLPYYPGIHQKRWRIRREYGNGTVGDMAVHIFDMVRWILDKKWPRRITGNGGIFVNKNSVCNTFDTQNITWGFDDLTVTWEHRHWSEVRDAQFPWAATLYGTKGTLKASPCRYDFKSKNSNDHISRQAETEFDKYPSDKTEPGLETQYAGANRAHMWNFLARIVDRQRPHSDIEDGCISTVCCILGNLSTQLSGVSLEWNPETFTVENCPEANALLARDYRSPWIHP